MIKILTFGQNPETSTYRVETLIASSNNWIKPQQIVCNKIISTEYSNTIQLNFFWVRNPIETEKHISEFHLSVC